MTIFDPSLYLVTDSENTDADFLLKRLKLALPNGVTMVQLRDKSLTDGLMLSLALKVKSLCKAYALPLIINDRVDIALASGANGVHVGGDDLPIEVVRRLMGPKSIVGATVKTINEATLAEKAGANYLGVGAIYPTDTKNDVEVMPIEIVKSICKSVKIPVVAIGGLKADNLDILENSGIKGVCVVSAIMGAKNIIAATKTLRQKFCG
ncbi:MAG: thiamine phosphate synthase [Candidatus Adiutrix sp.]